MFGIETLDKQIGDFDHQRGAAKGLLEPDDEDGDEGVGGGASAWRGEFAPLS